MDQLGVQKKTSFQILLWPLVAFLILALIVFAERSGIKYEIKPSQAGFLPQELLLRTHPEQETTTLLLYSTREEYSPVRNIQFVLDAMSIGVDTVNIDAEIIPSFESYQNIVLALFQLDALQDQLLELMSWVENGGGLFFAQSPLPTKTLSVIGPRIGIINNDLNYAPQQRVEILTDLLPGGKGLNLAWSGEDEENMRYGLDIQVRDDCIVHMRSSGIKGAAMLWECSLGSGKIVFNNTDAAYSKWSRGLIAAAFSLLGDACAYPVINASMFFIDDFPAPVPEGTNEYIFRDYQTSIEYFYVNIWFPDMLELAQKYRLKYTGMIIETYNEEVEPPFERPDGVSRFEYFGSMLLSEGFEIGLHGYNHMSLVLDDFDYQGHLDYVKWHSVAEMAEALRETVALTKELFPALELQTYIPPSNVLSEQGREALRKYFPQINALSSLYVDGDFNLDQEFGVGEDGLIEIPRIAAGFVLEDENRWAILSELCFHYVNSHFIHPDDTLDPERGAIKGWDVLRRAYDDFLSWLSISAPGLRYCTAQEGAMAVQRYSNLVVETKHTETSLQLDLTGFYDEAWLLLRVNRGYPVKIFGGTLEEVGEQLYLLHALEPTIEIEIDK